MSSFCFLPSFRPSPSFVLKVLQNVIVYVFVTYTANAVTIEMCIAQAAAIPETAEGSAVSERCGFLVPHCEVRWVHSLEQAHRGVIIGSHCAF